MAQLILNASSADGYISSTYFNEEGIGTTYSDARAGTGTSLTADTTGTLSVGQNQETSVMEIWGSITESFISFDTSSLRPFDKITSITLSLYTPGFTQDATSFTVNARVKDWGASLTTADWDTTYNGTLVAHSLISGTIGSGTRNFTTDNMNAINKGGETRLLLVSDKTESGTAPPTQRPGNPSEYDSITFHSSTDANPPILTINYLDDRYPQIDTTTTFSIDLDICVNRLAGTKEYYLIKDTSLSTSLSLIKATNKNIDNIFATGTIPYLIKKVIPVSTISPSLTMDVGLTPLMNRPLNLSMTISASLDDRPNKAHSLTLSMNPTLTKVVSRGGVPSYTYSRALNTITYSFNSNTGDYTVRRYHWYDDMAEDTTYSNQDSTSATLTIGYTSTSDPPYFSEYEYTGVFPFTTTSLSGKTVSSWTASLVNNGTGIRTDVTSWWVSGTIDTGGVSTLSFRNNLIGPTLFRTAEYSGQSSDPLLHVDVLESILTAIVNKKVILGASNNIAPSLTLTPGLTANKITYIRVTLTPTLTKKVLTNSYSLVGNNADNYMTKSNADWSVIRQATASSIGDSGYTWYGLQITSSPTSITQIGVCFDTSSVPDSYTVDNAQIVLYDDTQSDANNNKMYMYVKDYNWGSTLTTSDWVTGDNAYSTIGIATSMTNKDRGGVVDGVANGTVTFPLTSFSSISKTGVDYFVIIPASLESATAPTVSSSRTFSASNTGNPSNQKPKLIVSQFRASYVPSTLNTTVTMGVGLAKKRILTTTNPLNADVTLTPSLTTNMIFGQSVSTSFTLDIDIQTPKFIPFRWIVGLEVLRNKTIDSSVTFDVGLLAESDVSGNNTSIDNDLTLTPELITTLSALRSIDVSLETNPSLVTTLSAIRSIDVELGTTVDIDATLVLTKLIDNTLETNVNLSALLMSSRLIDINLGTNPNLITTLSALRSIDVSLSTNANLVTTLSALRSVDISLETNPSLTTKLSALRSIDINLGTNADIDATLVLVRPIDTIVTLITNITTKLSALRSIDVNLGTNASLTTTLSALRSISVSLLTNANIITTLSALRSVDVSLSTNANLISSLISARSIDIVLSTGVDLDPTFVSTRLIDISLSTNPSLTTALSARRSIDVNLGTNVELITNLASTSARLGAPGTRLAKIRLAGTMGGTPLNQSPSKPLSGTSYGSSSATASLITHLTFEQTIGGTSSTSGSLSVDHSLIGQSDGQSDAYSTLVVNKGLSGQSSGDSNTTANMAVNYSITGQSDGTSDSTSLTFEISHSLIGTSDGTASVDQSNIGINYGITATSNGDSTGSSTLITSATLSGSSDGLSTASSSLSNYLILTGGAQGNSISDDRMLEINHRLFPEVIQGLATVNSALIKAIKKLDGMSQGISTINAPSVSVNYTINGTSNGLTTTSAVLMALYILAGESNASAFIDELMLNINHGITGEGSDGSSSAVVILFSRVRSVDGTKQSARLDKLYQSVDERRPKT